jgi:hypothetical protein
MGNKGILSTNYIYFTGLLLLVAALPLSLFVISISQFVLAAAFLMEGDVRVKLKKFLSNKTALLFTGIWLLHLIGLAWTENFDEGLKDLRIKLPLLLIPLFVAGSKPLTAKQFRWLLLIFVSAVFCASLISMAVLVGIIERDIRDIRDIFIFNISHIRFALFVCLSIFILFRLAFQERKNVRPVFKILSVLLAVWLFLFLIIVESVTGILIFSTTGILLLLYYVFKSSNLALRIILGVSILVLPLAAILVLQKFVADYYQTHPYPINTSDKTALGNEYGFNLEDPQYENGYPIWVYICDKELSDTWNQVSTIPYDSLDERKQPLRHTLIRFLASKGLRKDADGVKKLSQKEIRSIERGIANVNYQEISSLKARFMQIVWEFDQSIRGANPSGHSVTQRFEFWKAAVGISAKNFFIGVGTGDMPAAYHVQYDLMKSSLDENHRLRAHNQYLAILVAFGILGLIYFISAFFFPLLYFKRNVGYLFFVFFIIIALSMLTEDTMETQVGATFTALFYFVFLFADPERAHS